jgi:hypothetical protein
LPSNAVAKESLTASSVDSGHTIEEFSTGDIVEAFHEGSWRKAKVCFSDFA